MRAIHSNSLLHVPHLRLGRLARLLLASLLAMVLASVALTSPRPVASASASTTI